MSFGVASISTPAQVREIDNLLPGQKVPAEIFTKYDSKEIARALVNRIHQQADSFLPPSQLDRTVVVPAKPEKLLQVRMRIEGKVVEKVIKHGFLNQYDTQNSNGTFDPSYRYKTESGWVDLPKRVEVYDLGDEAKKTLHQTLPKYGYVVSPGAPEALGDSQNPDSYGSIIVIFKPSVQNRSSFSYGDSLGKKMSGLFKTFRADSTHWIKESTYTEAQIWGELGLKDVQEFWIPDGISNATRKALEKTGVPVSTYELPQLVLEDDCHEPRTSKPLFNGRPPKFRSVSTKVREAMLERILAKGTPEMRKFLINCVFAKPDILRSLELLSFTIEHGDDEVRKLLETNVFIQNFMKRPELEPLKRANQISDSAERKAFLHDNLKSVLKAFARESAKDPKEEKAEAPRHGPHRHPTEF